MFPTDNSSQRVLHIQLETQRQYEQTMKNLEQVNATVTYIVTAIRDMESMIESKISSVAGLIGGTGGVYVPRSCWFHI